MCLFSQLQVCTGVISTCYPTDQLMHRVSDRFVQQPRGIAMTPSREAARSHSRGRSLGDGGCGDRSACSLPVSTTSSRDYVWSPLHSSGPAACGRVPFAQSARPLGALVTIPLGADCCAAWRSITVALRVRQARVLVTRSQVNVTVWRARSPGFKDGVSRPLYLFALRYPMHTVPPTKLWGWPVRFTTSVSQRGLAPKGNVSARVMFPKGSLPGA